MGTFLLIFVGVLIAIEVVATITQIWWTGRQ